MAWTTPRDWTTGELVTSTLLDTHLRDNMRWLGGYSGFGTSLPATPVNGEPFIYTDSLTAPSYLWHLRYFSALAANKWICVGGLPARSYLDPDAGTSNTDYTAQWTQTLDLPVAGLYEVTISAQALPAGAYGTSGAVSYDVGATVAADAWAATAYCANSAMPGAGTRIYWHTIAGATTLTVKCKSVSGGQYPNWNDVELKAIPVGLA